MRYACIILIHEYVNKHTYTYNIINKLTFAYAHVSNSTSELERLAQ